MQARVRVLSFAALFSLICLTAGAAAADWRFEFLGATTTALSNPHDIKLSPDGKHLFVSDVGNDRVVVLDADTLARVDAFGGELLDGTHDVDFDDDGRLYVADTHKGRVAIFALQGTRGELVGSLSDRLSGPEGVLVHPNGMIYVAGAWSNNVVAYRDGEVVHELRGLSAPHDLELAADGRIWLADAGNDRLLLLSEALAVVDELSGPPFDFDGVRYLDVMPDGTLIAADKYTHSVKVVDPQGRLLATLGDGRPGKGEGRFRTPEGVEIAGDILWLSDSGNDRVVKYRILR
jgi:DNA-binding beta-propeller fold protein YncE